MSQFTVRQALRVGAMRVIAEEADAACQKYPPFNSTHEGYAVIKEELDELWEEVRRNNRDRAVEEAVQVAAMALRFAAEFSAPDPSVSYETPSEVGK